LGSVGRPPVVGDSLNFNLLTELYILRIAFGRVSRFRALPDFPFGPRLGSLRWSRYSKLTLQCQRNGTRRGLAQANIGRYLLFTTNLSQRFLFKHSINHLNRSLFLKPVSKSFSNTDKMGHLITVATCVSSLFFFGCSLRPFLCL
jgi:hypothetical protein